MSTIQSTNKQKPRKGRAGDYSNPNKPQSSNMPQKYKDMIAAGKDRNEVYRMWEQEVNLEKLKAEAIAKAQWIKDHPEQWEAMQPKKKTGFFASLVSFGYDLLGKGAESLIKSTIGEIPVIGGTIGDYLGGKARGALESAGEAVREGVPVKRGGILTGDDHIIHLVAHHHRKHYDTNHPLVHRTSYYHGGKITGSKKDYEAEEDTIPAMLQAGEIVLPRVYAKMGLNMLKKEKLPLPIPAKVEKVMHEFKHHKLHDSHGKIVKNKDQAIAIALNVARHHK